jgi:hypothetical protein
VADVFAYGVLLDEPGQSIPGLRVNPVPGAGVVNGRRRAVAFSGAPHIHRSRAAAPLQALSQHIDQLHLPYLWHTISLMLLRL